MLDSSSSALSTNCSTPPLYVLYAITWPFTVDVAKKHPTFTRQIFTAQPRCTASAASSVCQFFFFLSFFFPFLFFFPFFLFFPFFSFFFSFPPKELSLRYALECEGGRSGLRFVIAISDGIVSRWLVFVPSFSLPDKGNGQVRGGSSGWQGIGVGSLALQFCCQNSEHLTVSPSVSSLRERLTLHPVRMCRNVTLP